MRCEKVIKNTTIIIINGEYWIHIQYINDQYTKQETNKNIRFPTGHWQNINHECTGINVTLLSPFFYFLYLLRMRSRNIAIVHVKLSC